MEKVKSKPLHLMIVMTLSVVLLVGFIYYDQPLAEMTSIVDVSILVEQAKAFNGQEIMYQGEVIGDIMPRQDHYWINVLGKDGTAIGIWITAEQRDTINMAGQYGIQGDSVKIIGQFSQACSEHGGDLDIHANSVEIISKGKIITQKLNVTRVIIAACLFLLASFLIIMLIINRLKRKDLRIK